MVYNLSHWFSDIFAHDTVFPDANYCGILNTESVSWQHCGKSESGASNIRMIMLRIPYLNVLSSAITLKISRHTYETARHTYENSRHTYGNSQHTYGNSRHTYGNSRHNFLQPLT